MATRTTNEGILKISVMRAILATIAVCAAAIAPAQGARAEQAKQASIIVDANTGKVLHAQNADEPRFPASLTKMMTLYILFGEIEQGRLALDSKIPFSERATGVAPSKLGLEVGEEIEVSDAIKALVVKSANDVAVAVAEKIGGSEPQFARIDDGACPGHRHDVDHFPQCVGSAEPRTALDRAGHGHARHAAAGRLPQYYRCFDALVHVPRKDPQVAQFADARLSRHGRHQNRLYARVGVQPRVVGPGRRQASRGRRVRRQNGANAGGAATAAIQRTGTEGAGPYRPTTMTIFLRFDIPRFWPTRHSSDLQRRNRWSARTTSDVASAETAELARRPRGDTWLGLALHELSVSITCQNSIRSRTFTPGAVRYRRARRSPWPTSSTKFSSPT